MKKLLLRMIRGYVLEYLQEKAFKKLRRLAKETNNTLDDEAVTLLENVITDELRRL